MGKIRLIFGGVLLVVVAMLSIVYSPHTNAQPKSNETYRWASYDTIDASLGAYRNFLEEGESFVSFTQSGENPLQYTSSISTDECNTTLTLTIDAENASVARVANSGGCSSAAAMDNPVRIDGAPGAISIVQSEENTMKQDYFTVACSEEEAATQTECREAAQARFTSTQNTCMAAHNYRQHITRANAYLDCLSEALGVDRPSSDAEGEGEEATQPQGCQIPDVGWIVCQLSEFVSQITDHTFSILQPFLVIEPLNQEISPDTDSATYTAWGNIRDIANVLLIVGFLIVIFSQLTGVGINAYHIKRSLPRIIVASILINVSFFVCALFIDISNIAGKTAQDVTTYFSRETVSQSTIFTDWQTTTNRILTISPTDAHFNQQAAGVDPNAETEEQEGEEGEETPEETPPEDDSIYNDSEEDTTMIINGVTITGTAVLFANLAILLPIMVFALFAVFAALMVLLFRQALVIILVVLSPLAFAAIMLPGTKRWYDKWQSVTIQLLMLYPIVALIYAASQLAAEIIRESAANNGHTLIAIFSLGIQMIPLFVTPLLLKFSGKAMNQFSGIVRGMSSAPRKAAMGRARSFQQERKQLRNARLQAGRVGFGKVKVPGGEKVGQLLPSNIATSFKTGRRHRKARLETEQRRAAAQHTRDFLKNINDQELVNAAQASADAQIYDADVAKVSAAANVYERQGLTQAEYVNMTLTGRGLDGKDLSEVEHRAVAKLAMEGASAEDAHKLLEVGASGGVPRPVSQEIAKAANARGISKESFEVSQSFLGAAGLGAGNKDAAMVGAINSKRLSPEAAPLQAPETMERAQEALNNSTDITPEARNAFAKTMTRGLVNENVGKGREDTIDKMVDIINDSLERGDITLEELAQNLTHGKAKDKTAAYAKVFEEVMKRGNFDMQEALKSDTFAQEFYNNDDMMKSMLNAGVRSLDKAAEHVQTNPLNDETMAFYKDAVLHGLAGSGPQNPEQLHSIESFVSEVKKSLNNPGIGSKERATAEALVSEYNKKVGFHGRRI
ncbi:MAG: hypothetical protein ACTJG2_04125 [Candidatus Saccharimonadales bacterium]